MKVHHDSSIDYLSIDFAEEVEARSPLTTRDPVRALVEPFLTLTQPRGGVPPNPHHLSCIDRKTAMTGT
jgi:hypothetical protein